MASSFVLPADFIPFVRSSIYFGMSNLLDEKQNLESWKNMKHLLTFILRDCHSGVEKDPQKTDFYKSTDDSAADI